MCGIAGIYSWGGGMEKKTLAALAKGMADRLTHRGPESEGYYTADDLVLGHRRLKIIDLSTGDQPIYNEDRTIAIVFNGEIYNYQKLRQMLETRGHTFATASDTESIVHAYEEFGVDCLSHLDGMFAFALWDSQRKRLFLAVDRLGIKPIVYHQRGQSLFFASEIGALSQLPGSDFHLNHQAMAHYFDFGYIPRPQTILQEVFRLPPGHFLTVEGGKVGCQRYWNVLETLEPVADEATARERLRGLMAAAVEKRLIADVPLGAFLSGGIDSSIVVGQMARLMSTPVKTFSIGFADQPLLDESAYAAAVARFNGTDHHAYKLSYQDVLAAIPAALDSLGEPFADYSFIPTYLVSRETRRAVTVALSGDGADELFGGYNKYRAEGYQQVYFALPAFVRNRMVQPLVHSLPVGRRSRAAEMVRQARRFLDGVSEDPVARHVGMMRIVRPEVRAAVLRTNGGGTAVHTAVGELYAQAYSAWPGDTINPMLLTDVHIGLPFDMLTKVDLASMQHALEVRVPFLDHQLVAFAFSLPGKWKLQGKNGKKILKETFSDFFPPELKKRRKQGFDLPVGDWFKREMRETFHDVVFNGRGADPILNLETIRQLYGDHCQERADYTKLLWSVFTFQWWRHGAGASFA